MTRRALLEFIRRHDYAVEASASTAGPQAAVVGIAVTDAFEVVFDTLGTSRKAQNLRTHPRVAFVIGGCARSDAQTVQYEGIADEPAGEALAALKQVYFGRFPDGVAREQWDGIT